MSSLEIDKKQKGRLSMNSDEKLVVRTRRNKSFGSIIQEYRQRNGWTQDELAWRVGVTRAQIGRIERNQCVPTVATVEKIERALQLPRLTLLEVKQKEESQVRARTDAEEKVGRAFRDLEREMLLNMNDHELESVSNAVNAFTALSAHRGRNRGRNRSVIFMAWCLLKSCESGL